MVAPLVVLLVVVFAGSLLALRYVLTRYVAQATGHLQTLSRDAIDQREALQRRVEETERQRREQLTKVQEEVQELRAKALAEAEAARQQALTQARAEAEQVVAQAMEARKALLQEQTALIESKAVERACDLVAQVLPHALREAVHSRWLDELIEDGLVPERLATHEQVREATVVSAFPLAAAQRTRLTARLQAAFGPSLTIHESVDARFVAGLTVTAGHLVLDGSLASKLHEATRHAQRAA